MNFEQHAPVATTTTSAFKRWVKAFLDAKIVEPLTFVQSCCQLSFMQANSVHHGPIESQLRLDMVDPGRANLLILGGSLSPKMLPYALETYQKMKKKSQVLVVGTCALSGGPYALGYHTVLGLENYFNIDYVLEGCPPTPQQIVKMLEWIEKSDVQESQNDFN